MQLFTSRPGKAFQMTWKINWSNRYPFHWLLTCIFGLHGRSNCYVTWLLSLERSSIFNSL